METKDSRLFPYLVGLRVLGKRGFTFYSVFGLSKLFSALGLVVVIAGSLEVGLVTAFLYRYWDDINRWMKTYLIVGVITLVIITSRYLWIPIQPIKVLPGPFEKESTAYCTNKID